MSDFRLTVADVAKMAVNMETKGMNFYNWAAKQFDDPSVKNIFLKLSEEEKEHIKIFSKLLQVPGSNEFLNPKVGMYLTILGEREDIFPHHAGIKADTIKSPERALAVGIQAEKDAILFYQELFNETESPEVKSALSTLLEEEKMHLLELREYMDEMKVLKH